MPQIGRQFGKGEGYLVQFAMADKGHHCMLPIFPEFGQSQGAFQSQLRLTGLSQFGNGIHLGKDLVPDICKMGKAPLSGGQQSCGDEPADDKPFHKRSFRTR